jgi:hypothetical protein
MESPGTRSKPSDVQEEQQTSAEIVRLIRKLRWLGMDEEAKRLQIKLRRERSVGSVLAAPRDSD